LDSQKFRMGGYVLSSQAEHELLDKYYRAWTNHDVGLVREIFDLSATYDIEGKRGLRGQAEIVKYWERNAGRQRNLNILPPIKSAAEAGTISSIFCATFVDVEENQSQTVYGQVNLHCEGRKIVRLKESYNVFRTPLSSSRVSFPSFHELALRCYWRLKGMLLIAAELMITRGATVFLALMAILLGYSSFNVRRLPDVLLCGMTFNFSDCATLSLARHDELIDSANRAISLLASTFVVFVLFLGWIRYKLRNSIQIIPLLAANHDLMVMKSRFRSAEELTIFAGDFDFVSSDKEFRDTFKYLNDRGTLILISDKKEELVRKGFGSEPDAVNLFAALKRDGKIYFERGVPIRCSIVRRWSRSEILYRYKGGSADSLTDLHICVLRGRREAGPVIELVQKLVAKVVD
jgi:hypothetical protein